MICICPTDGHDEMCPVCVPNTQQITKITLRKRRNEFGEYVIRVWVNGKRHPDADYFTNDWDDASGTYKLMLETAGL